MLAQIHIPMQLEKHKHEIKNYQPRGSLTALDATVRLHETHHHLETLTNIRYSKCLFRAERKIGKGGKNTFMCLDCILVS
jgi:hypothetical protein